MTERPGTAGPAGPDRVADTLTALRSDIDSIPLAESGAVRRRGEVRTRNQIVGSTLVVVALVAGAIGLGAGLTGDDKVLVPPATPGPSTSAAQTLDLAAEPLLEPADVPRVGPYTGWLANPDPDAADEKFLQCLDSPTRLGAEQTEKRYFYTDLDARLAEHVLRFATVARARSAVDAFQRQLDDCTAQSDGDPTVSDAMSAGSDVGDGGFTWTRT